MASNNIALRILHDDAPAQPPPRIDTPAGASATTEGDTIVVRDPRGAIVVTYDAVSGSATIAAPEGDLRLRAAGKVVVEAGTVLELSARAKTRIQSVELELCTDLTQLRTKALSVVSGALEGSALNVALRLGRVQLTAESIRERARDVYRDVEGVIETRAGRLRTLVRGATQVRSGSTSIVSEEDTFIDGSRVLLG
jgi:hypothetical protein